MNNKQVRHLSYAVINTMHFRRIIAIAEFEYDNSADVVMTIAKLREFVESRAIKHPALHVHRDALDRLRLEPEFKDKYVPQQDSEKELVGLVGHFVGAPVLCDDMMPIVSRAWQPLKANQLLVLHAEPLDHEVMKGDDDQQQPNVFSH